MTNYCSKHLIQFVYFGSTLHYCWTAAESVIFALTSFIGIYYTSILSDQNHKTNWKQKIMKKIIWIFYFCALKKSLLIK